MPEHKRNTIFKQLILNIIIPVAIALTVVALVNSYMLFDIETSNEEAKNELVTDEIKNILEFQDVALNLIESNLNAKIEDYSHRLITEYFSDTKNIETVDLYEIRDELNLDPKLFDFYIIKSNGVIVNTTLKSDLGLDLFSFGKEMQNKLETVLRKKSFLSDHFETEVSTRKLKKYSYHATIDRKYIVQIGMYSEEAFDISEKFVERLNTISAETNIKSIDLFINPEQPFSKFSDATLVDTNHINMVQKVFETTHTYITFTKEEGRELKHAYVYLGMGTDSAESNLAVIRIVSDITDSHILIRNLMLFSLLLLILTLGIMSGFFYKKIGGITLPILHLVQKAIKITEGNLEERVEIVGDNEVTTLSEQFNLMVQKLEHSYHEIVEQKKDLEDSIHYAQRIQNAILPPKQLRQRILPNSFVLYKPKDIVSGDFYWMDEKDNKTLFSVVDCTGHGVPGAFMSIVGYNGLNRAVGDHNKTAPGEILDDLNDSVTGSLRQQEDQSAVKDGMDLALCSIDLKSRVLQYAGANNPLYVVRSCKEPHLEGREITITNDDYNLFEYKADKQPIGSYLEHRKFTTHTIQLLEGDAVYIFSDGFADQFGGERGKKFKYKPFKQLLLSNQHKPLEIQRDVLDEAIEGWRGELEQIDDICIIGIRV